MTLGVNVILDNIRIVFTVQCAVHYRVNSMLHAKIKNLKNIDISDRHVKKIHHGKP